MSPLDNILLDRFGVEQGRIQAKGKDEYYLEVNSGGDYTWKGKKYSGQAVRVNSKETVIGDIKEANPWNGQMVELGDEHYQRIVSKATHEINASVTEDAGPTVGMNPSYYFGKLLNTI